MNPQLPDSKLQQDRLFYYEARRIFGADEAKVDTHIPCAFQIQAADGEHYATLNFIFAEHKGGMEMWISFANRNTAFLHKSTRAGRPMAEKLRNWRKQLAALNFPHLDFRVRVQLTALLQWQPPHQRTLKSATFPTDH